MDQDEYVLWKEYFENMEKDDADIKRLAKELEIEESEIKIQVSLELSYGDYKMHHRETQQVLERIQNECAVKF